MPRFMLSILLSLLLSTSVFAQVGVLDEGTRLGPAWDLNCVGSVLTCSKTGRQGTLTVDSSTLQLAANTPVRVTVASDVSNSNSAAYTAVSDLSIAVATSTNYQIECHFLTSAAAGTTGLQLQVTGPGSPTEVTIVRDYYNNVTTGATVLVATAFNSGSTDDAAAGSCSTTRCINPVHIFLRNGSNSGTVAFAIQTEVNASAVTMHRGSYCDTRVATF